MRKSSGPPGPPEDAHREARAIAADHFEVALFDAGGFLYWSTRDDVFNNTLNEHHAAMIQQRSK